MDNLLWELYQQRSIRKAQSEVSQAAKDSSKAQTDVYALESKIDHLALICRAMWSLLREQTELSEQDLIARVKEFDMDDGVKDNKLRKTKECYSCGKTLGPKDESCMYCGVKIPIGNAFNKI